MDTNILLESGTNECEILEFMVGGNYYGINVAKIREILPYQNLTPIPNAHPNIEGAFSTRGETISIVNLARALGMPAGEMDPQKEMFLITQFNNICTGFHVQKVIGIHRVNWSHIVKPDSIISNSASSIITGIVNLDKKLVLILDFESIVAEISPDVCLNKQNLSQLGSRRVNTSPIVYAEDSQLLSMEIYEALTGAGYVKVMPTNNGLELWQILQQYKAEGSLKQNVSCVVTDIEMPQMDGHRLLKMMKEDPEMRDIPVIIFSSLINEEMEKKGQELGASAQLSKKDISELIRTLDKLLIGE